MRYRADARSRRELRKLVDIERVCCAFLTWIISDHTDTLTLHIRGTPAQLDTLSP